MSIRQSRWARDLMRNEQEPITYANAIEILAPAMAQISRLVDELGGNPDPEIRVAVQAIRIRLQVLDGQLAELLGVAGAERRRVPPQPLNDALAEAVRRRG